MKTLSDLLLVVAAVASMAMSGFGFSIGVWGGFWSGTGVGAILNLLLWLLPTLSVIAFVISLVSRSVGLKCAWAIAIGSMITAFWSLASGQFTTIVCIFPLIQLIACFTLYGDTRIQNKIRQRLAPGNDAG